MQSTATTPSTDIFDAIRINSLFGGDLSLENILNALEKLEQRIVMPAIPVLPATPLSPLSPLQASTQVPHCEPPAYSDVIEDIADEPIASADMPVNADANIDDFTKCNDAIMVLKQCMCRVDKENKEELIDKLLPIIMRNSKMRIYQE